ncbi:hypothetical protein ACFE04_021506 [Oxalis oulophora]
MAQRHELSSFIGGIYKQVSLISGSDLLWRLMDSVARCYQGPCSYRHRGPHPPIRTLSPTPAQPRAVGGPVTEIERPIEWLSSTVEERARSVDQWQRERPNEWLSSTVEERSSVGCLKIDRLALQTDYDVCMFVYQKTAVCL